MSTTAQPASSAAEPSPSPGDVDVPLRWLADAGPDLTLGATCGAPLPRARMQPADLAESLAVLDSDGEAVPAQLWPLATWPDGSVKWCGVALGADRPAACRYRLVSSSGEAKADAARPQSITVEEADTEIRVHTGPAQVSIPRSGAEVVSWIKIGAQVVARAGRLVSSSQDHPEPDHLRRVNGQSTVSSAVVEQYGPIRAVVRIEGEHLREDGRRWLPFTLRLVLIAGSSTVRLVHSFIWDGDGEKDYLAGLGLDFTVPLHAPAYDRHVRLAGADGGFLSEAVQGLTGLRRDPGQEVREAQMVGRAVPVPETWPWQVRDRLQWIPTWAEYRLRQENANGFTVHKRTGTDHPWIEAAAGTRAQGLGYVGDTQGGLAIGLADFWQSHPTGIDVTAATGDAAHLTMWLYSPDAPPMDMRFYHDGLGQENHADQLDALEITYEDYEPGFGDAHGIGRTHEMTITGVATTPPVSDLVRITQVTARRPQLLPTPSALQRAGAFGDWDVVDTSTPERAQLEARLAFLLDFYVGQVDQRSWYGFWNYGDVRHAYDADRHTWRYDVGGYAWDNSELSPDLWLWTSFCRTGRADVFRMAEAMTRHTGDVDVYHLGPWRGLGSRHNVQHWGCSAKQLRISTPAYRRIHYFLTADEHTRDLMLQLRDSDTTFLGLDPTRKVRSDAATYRPERTALAVSLGTDWSALAATWLADWEITGNTWSRDRLLGTMADIGALTYGFLTGEALYDLDTGRFDTSRERVSVSHLSAVFGLVEICSELVNLVDVPGFAAAWEQYCRLYLAPADEQIAEVGMELSGTNLHQAHSRLLAYAASRQEDPRLRAEWARRAWSAYFTGGEFMGEDAFRAVRVVPPEVLAPVEEARGLSTNDAAQCGLATIQNLALIEKYLPG